MVETKECCTCKKEKCISEFHSYSSSKDGLQPRCKECKAKSNVRDNNNRNNYARSRYPTPHDNCVYAFKYKGDIVYIGSSDMTSFRLYHHMKYPLGNSRSALAKKYTIADRLVNMTWHILWYGDSNEDRVHQEKMLIQIHQPELNHIKYKNYNG